MLFFVASLFPHSYIEKNGEAVHVGTRFNIE